MAHGACRLVATDGGECGLASPAYEDDAGWEDEVRVMGPESGI